MAIVKLRPSMLRCPKCGVTQEASCNCGVGYLSARQYAEIAIKQHAEKSDRAIAAATGLDHKTVAAARKAVGENSPTEKSDKETKRVGRDGKKYKAKKPKLRVVADNTMPTDEEAEQSWQNDVFEHACFMLDKKMTPATRQRFFAYIKRKYANATS